LQLSRGCLRSFDMIRSLPCTAAIY
jgi:hypothetical protein